MINLLIIKQWLGAYLVPSPYINQWWLNSRMRTYEMSFQEELKE